MIIINKIVGAYFAKREVDIKKQIQQPIDCQFEVWKSLLKKAQHTEYGKLYDFGSIKSIEEYANRLPIVTYDSLYPYIERVIKGEKNVLWFGKTTIFSKSSGTSGNKSKFIPITQDALFGNNYKSGKDSLTIYINNCPHTKLFNGKTFSLTGTLSVSPLNPNAHCGDVSAILLKSLPSWANFFKTPPYKIALMADWDKKMEAFAQHLRHQNVVAMAGVPSWILMIVNRILALENKNNLHAIWKNLELYMHGGVNFLPYKQHYQSITNDNLYYMQIYNASEGYFAAQDIPNAEDMLLFVNNGVFYEFIPLSDYLSGSRTAISLDKVQVGVNYVVIISTNAGLWRYEIGDVVIFTSINPYRIIITGRTSHYINTFGEEVIMDNVEKAISEACCQTLSTITEYTVAPIYMSNKTKAAHQWLIEFKKIPTNIDYFRKVLDDSLKRLNSDYEAKRSNDILLQIPDIVVLPEKTFENWLTEKKRLGGQFKVKRLSNDRLIADELLEMIKK